MVGSYIGDNTVTVAIVGSNLTLTWYDFFTGTCIYSASISSATNAVGSGTYQCSNFTTGSWSLLQMKIVDAGDVYIEIVLNGTIVKRHYGMSGIAVLIAPTPILDIVSTLVGTYSSTLGTANTAVGFLSYAEDPTTITVGISGTTLTITAVHFWAGTCIYTATYSASTNTVSAGTYQCSDFTTGSWSLSKMKLVSSGDVYIAISKNGSSNATRMYGAK